MPRKNQPDSPTLIELPNEPDDWYERRARRRGARIVAGVDEAGRGPLAGPVVVAAVHFEGRRPKGLNDSKKLTAAERERLFDEIMRLGHVSVVVASRERVDRMNILRASLWGMSRAVAGLPVRPDHVLIDGRDNAPGLPCPGEPIIGGDGLSVSIAAASIVAKVTRDRLMISLARDFPLYGFENHVGYSTPEHLRALAAHGPCIHHRRTFQRVKALLEPGAAGEAEPLLFDEAEAA
ncbi:MAG: ribonuclease HII [Bauldia sp.]|nr:ribonuclease HII [Bauldia sp.]